MNFIHDGYLDETNNLSFFLSNFITNILEMKSRYICLRMKITSDIKWCQCGKSLSYVYFS